MHFNIVLPSTSRSFKWSPSLRYLNQTLYALLLSPMRATCPSNLILLGLITVTLYVSANHEASLNAVVSIPTTLLRCLNVQEDVGPVWEGGEGIENKKYLTSTGVRTLKIPACSDFLHRPCPSFNGNCMYLND